MCDYVINPISISKFPPIYFLILFLQRLLLICAFLMVRPSSIFHASPVPLHSKAAIARPRVPAALSLDHFLQRQRVLGFWREVVRATNKISNQSVRSEMRNFAREEFERNRHVADLTQVRYLVSTGREQMKNMQRYVDEMIR